MKSDGSSAKLVNSKKLTELIDCCSYLSEDSILEIKRAYKIACDFHCSQKRASGEPYISHLEEVAILCSKLQLDGKSVVAALLHDIVEDTPLTEEDLAKEFDSEVASLVSGVTKLSKIKSRNRSKVEEQASNFRKMLLAMAKDIRVLLIKLCDRTHNMRTLQHLRPDKQKRIARETLDIFAPLAHRLGIYWLKSELEDLSFRYLNPEEFQKIKSFVKVKKEEREDYNLHVKELLKDLLHGQGIEAKVTGRSKNFYSIYKKCQRRGIALGEMYDLNAFRIIVQDALECYQSLGVIHSKWKPIPGRFKDYIAMPKANGYQSLHTTVFGPEASRIEIQIRTKKMHEVAEKGNASHWAYKEGKTITPSEEGVGFTWFRDLLESEKLENSPKEFIDNIKGDLFSRSIYVFSPRGDCFPLAVGSTPVDFAYSIHTEVGNTCKSAKVDGVQVALSKKLKTGNTVEITTSPNQVPNKDWLSFVATTKAKQKIVSWLKNQEREKSIQLGRDILSRDLRKADITLTSFEKDQEKLSEVLEKTGNANFDSLLTSISAGKLTTRAILNIINPKESKTISDEERQNYFEQIVKEASKISRSKAGIKVSGLDDVVFKFAKCCDPLPGDRLLGYITQGRGVTIHKKDCKQVLTFDHNRLIPVSWDNSVRSSKAVTIKIICSDKVGILSKMTGIISSNGASIKKAQATSLENGKGENIFEIIINDSKQLSKIINTMKKIDGVSRVTRVTKH